jgi:hypothetical protein
VDKLLDWLVDMACGRELAGLASYMDDGLAGRLAGGLAGQFFCNNLLQSLIKRLIEQADSDKEYCTSGLPVEGTLTQKRLF